MNLIKLLLDHGADTKCRNNNRQTPEDVIPDPKNPGLIELLMQPAKKGGSEGPYPIPTTPPRCWHRAPNDASSDADGLTTNVTSNVCKSFFANVYFFYRTEQFSWSYSVSIHELLHEGAESNKSMVNLERKFVSIVRKAFKKEEDEVWDNVWKWIHIPTNQVCLVE